MVISASGSDPDSSMAMRDIEGAKTGDFSGIYSGPAEVRMAYDAGEVDLQARIEVRIEGKRVESTVGRVLVGEVLPEGTSFESVNKVLDKKALSELIDTCYRKSRNKNNREPPKKQRVPR